ncbi:MAG: hypothetical protein ACI832_000294 [Rheinheimera aquimaris]|jgi:hypothetical protein
MITINYVDLVSIHGGYSDADMHVNVATDKERATQRI